MPVDLDAVQERLALVAGIPDDHTTWWQIGTHDAPALVAELRAAREVIEAGWAVDRKDPGCYGRLYRALQAHKTLTEGGGS